MTTITDIVTRSGATLLGDAAGVLALAAFTYGMLYLPGLI